MFVANPKLILEVSWKFLFSLLFFRMLIDIYYLVFVGVQNWIQDGCILGQPRVLMEKVLLPVLDLSDLGEFI